MNRRSPTIPSGHGEGVYEGLAVRRHRAQVSRRKADQPDRASARSDVVSFNLNPLRAGEESLPPCKCRPRRSSLSFSGMLLTHRRFYQGCVVSCDACVAAPLTDAGLKSARDAWEDYRRATQLPVKRRPRRAPPPSTSRAGPPRQPQRTRELTPTGDSEEAAKPRGRVVHPGRRATQVARRGVQDHRRKRCHARAVMPIPVSTRPGRSPSECSGLAADNGTARSRRQFPGHRPPTLLGRRCAEQDLRLRVSRRP